MSAYCRVDLQLHTFFTLAVKAMSMISLTLIGSFCSKGNLFRYPLDMKLGSLLREREREKERQKEKEREREQAFATVDKISCSFGKQP
jgi:hypothetical protein